MDKLKKKMDKAKKASIEYKKERVLLLGKFERMMENVNISKNEIINKLTSLERLNTDEIKNNIRNFLTAQERLGTAEAQIMRDVDKIRVETKDVKKRRGVTIPMKDRITAEKLKFEYILREKAKTDPAYTKKYITDQLKLIENEDLLTLQRRTLAMGGPKPATVIPGTVVKDLRPATKGKTAPKIVSGTRVDIKKLETALNKTFPGTRKPANILNRIKKGTMTLEEAEEEIELQKEWGKKRKEKGKKKGWY